MTTREVVLRFAEACAAGDTEALVRVLAVDVELVVDSGGRVLAPLRPIRGWSASAERVIALFAARPAAEVELADVNGGTGLVVLRAGVTEAVISLAVDGPLVTAVWIVLNPDKLRHWNHRSPSHG
ncbi:siderophore-interacting protein [Kribbella amoyensis]|uniref:siderophore-interacting protein n=1 Tax=Kribbella amoyensis TaxID=996641 RepID=UPI0011A909BB|nr:siderophore-interacting protein [Kribbella amoyensis]